MTPTLQSVAASLIEKAASDLIAAARATPDEKVHWQAVPGTRPMLAQLVECCLANMMWAKTLQTHVHALLRKGVADQAYKELDTIEKVVTRLKETSSQLAAVIRGLPDADLSIIVPLPWKPEAGKSLAVCCLHPYWNMTYHLGQISYIQTMYGDWDEHGDAGPFGETDPGGGVVQ